MTNSKLKILTVAIIPILLSCGGGRTGFDKQAETIIGKHVVLFTRPPQRIPAKVSVDAPLLGNGYMGVALSGNPEHQVFYVARNDFWRLKAGHNESYPAVLGKIEVSIPGLQGASYLVEQHLYDAVTVARFAKDDFSVTYRTYVAADADVTVIEIGMKGKGSLEGSARLSLPGAKEIVERLPLDRAFPEKREQNVVDGIHYITRAFEDSVDIPTKAAMALQTLDSPDGRFTLEAGKTVRLVCTTSGNFKSSDCLGAAVSKVKESVAPQRLHELEKQHREWWKNYWEKSFVSIPDSAVEKQYYLSLYGMASSSRDIDFPPGLFGIWITQEQPAWAGDYHLNYNYQTPFYALYSANRIEQAEPYYAPLLAFIPRGKYYSEKIAGIPDGVIYPVGIGPLGIETTLWTPLMEQYRKGWREAGNIEYEGMFWGQKSNASYAVTNLSMHFYRTWDKAFTRKVYPFVRASAVFWEKYLVYENDRYVDYNDAIHEGRSIRDKNPLLSLGLIRQTMQTATDMSALLGEDADRREKWMHIHDHISDFPLQERNGKTVFRLTEEGMDWAGGNTLEIQHIYPAGQIGPDSNPELLAVAMNTMQEMQRWIDGNGSGNYFPATVRIGYDPDTILHHLDRYVKHTFPNGFQLDNPHGIENLSTVPNTVNEMLCMGHGDIVRLFPVWPRNRNASFHQIRVEGAFLVSAKLENGEIGDVTVFSEQGRALHLLNPWKGRRIKVKSPNGEQLYEGERIRINTEKGANSRLAPTGI
jgi:hypothetical protein